MSHPLILEIGRHRNSTSPMADAYYIKYNPNSYKPARLTCLYCQTLESLAEKELTKFLEERRCVSYK